MNRAELDEFFAKAEGVLTDWHSSADAMSARQDDEHAELRAADSYYDQWTPIGYAPSYGVRSRTEVGQVTMTSRPVTDLSQFAEGWERAMQQFAEIISTFLPPPLATRQAEIASPSNEVRAQALEARRVRNTGPADRRGIDGRYRRRSSA